MSAPSYSPQDARWRRLPEERPHQILEAAIAEFGEHGIGGARLERIASRAGVSKGTIYLYFASKEDLFREVVRQVVVPRMRETERKLEGGTPREQLERYIRIQWAHFEHPGAGAWVRLVLTELHRYPDLAAFYHAEAISKSNEVLGAILRRGMASGDFRKMDPLAAVSMIKAIALMHALWSQSPVPGVRARRTGVDTIVDFVLHALRPDGEKASR